MVRWRLKGCPRCGGDLFIEKDMDNWYEQCLLCSYRVDLKRLDSAKELVPAGEAGSKNRARGKKRVDCE